jgi:hypothetical protein
METLNALKTGNIQVANIAKNDYVVAIVALLAISYAGTFAPKLPNRVTSFLDNIVVKFIIFFVIAYAISRKVDVALISSLAVLALVLGIQVYFADKPEASEKKENMVGGFQKLYSNRQAEVSSNAGKFMENEQLNEVWTQQKGDVQGYSLDWPGYENVGVNDKIDTQSVISTVPAPSVDSSVPSVPSSVPSSAASSEIVAMNNNHNEPKDGEIVGVSKLDMSGLAKI